MNIGYLILNNTMFVFTGGWLKCLNLYVINYSVLADFQHKKFH